MQEQPSPPPTETPSDWEDQTPSDPSSPEDDTILDIRDFGAEVDGKADDTQAVLDAIYAAEPGETVLFPAGTTVVSAGENRHGAAIFLDGDEISDDMTIKGVGKDSVVKMGGGHEGHHRVFWFEVNSGYDGLVVRDLRVDGNKREQRGPLGRGGHGFQSYNADHANVPIDVLIENVWVEDCHQSGISIQHGGFVVNRCTVRNCAMHGIGVSSWTDVHKYDPPIEVKNCYATQNGRELQSPTYGINVSGGKVLIEDCVSENNGQGTKSTPQVLEATYRRVRLKDNDINGYLRTSPDSETGQRARIVFEDVVSEGNKGFGFRLGADTDYEVPAGTDLRSRRNTQENIFITQNATLEADTIWTTCAINGYGLHSTTSGEVHISELRHFNNASGLIRNNENTVVDNLVDISDDYREFETRPEILCNIDNGAVPTADDVGARSVDN